MRATFQTNPLRSAQLIIGILIAMVAALVYFATMPYKDFNDDMFSMFTHFQIFLVLLWSLLVKFQKLLEVEHEKLMVSEGTPEEEYVPPTALLRTETLGWLLILSNLSVMFVFFCFMMLEVKTANKSVKARKKWDLIKRGAAEEGLSAEEVLEKLGFDLSHTDKESILKKYELEVERASTLSGVGVSEKLEEDLDDGEEGIEMQENPVGKKAIGGRPFGGMGLQESVRHLSEAESVGLGSGQVALSKHQKYKDRAEKEKELSPHVARAQGFKNKGSGGKKKAAKPTAAKKPPERVVENDVNDDEDAPPPPPRKEQNVAKQSEWDEVWDEAQGANYYVNRVSGASVWEKPEGML